MGTADKRLFNDDDKSIWPMIPDAFRGIKRKANRIFYGPTKDKEKYNQYKEPENVGDTPKMMSEGAYSAAIAAASAKGLEQIAKIPAAARGPILLTTLLAGAGASTQAINATNTVLKYGVPYAVLRTALDTADKVGEHGYSWKAVEEAGKEGFIGGAANAVSKAMGSPDGLFGGMATSKIGHYLDTLLSGDEKEKKK